DSVLVNRTMCCAEKRGLTTEDLHHFLQHQELYVIAKHLADLKYLGAPMKSAKVRFGVGYVYPSPEWPKLFGAIRHYLMYPSPNRTDVVREYVRSGLVPANSMDDLMLLLAARPYPSE
ncbi:MAG: hypothetical protein ACYCYF_10365, partial [Anaerolineae bacterium]